MSEKENKARVDQIYESGNKKIEFSGRPTQNQKEDIENARSQLNAKISPREHAYLALGTHGLELNIESKPNSRNVG